MSFSMLLPKSSAFRRFRIRLAAGAGLAGLVAGAQPVVAIASSDAAWSQFRIAVTNACTAKAKMLFHDPIVLVDAHGSESYGIALIYGRSAAPRGTTPMPGLATVVCVYDKRTEKVELSGPLETEFTNP